MPETLSTDSPGNDQEAINENQKLRNQHRVAAERLQQAKDILKRAQDQLRDAQALNLRGDLTEATAAAEREVFRAEGLVGQEQERLDTHLKMTSMAAAENLDVLSADAKTEMDADLASRGEQPAGSDTDDLK